MDETVPFRILVVCTGNVCRSPMVERLLQDEYDKNSPGNFEIRSAGTHSLVGHGMTPEIADLVRQAGATDDGFSSRQLTEKVLANQDLVLALTREHRAKVLEVAPKLLRRTFALREFGRMVRFVMAETPDSQWPTDTHDRWNQLLHNAASVRHQVLDRPEADDVIDPFRRDDSVHQQMLSQIAPALEALSQFERDAVRSCEGNNNPSRMFGGNRGC